MLYLLKIKEKDKNDDYIAFIRANSGGSPIFTSQYKKEKSYKDLDCLYQKTQSYVGEELSRYAKTLTENEGQKTKKLSVEEIVKCAVFWVDTVKNGITKVE